MDTIYVIEFYGGWFNHNPVIALKNIDDVRAIVRSGANIVIYHAGEAYDACNGEMVTEDGEKKFFTF